MRLLRHSSRPIHCLSVVRRANLRGCARNLKLFNAFINTLSGSYSLAIVYDRIAVANRIPEPHWMPHAVGKNVDIFHWFRMLRRDHYVIHLFDITIFFD